MAKDSPGCGTAGRALRRQRDRAVRGFSNAEAIVRDSHVWPACGEPFMMSAGCRTPGVPGNLPCGSNAGSVVEVDMVVRCECDQ